MSTLKVEIKEIEEVLTHPNADRLDLVRLNEWFCVVQKGSYKAGDKCLYFPIDSVLPEAVESVIFPPESKVKLSKGRVKTIKLRGAISQGLVVEPELFNLESLPIGSDVTEILGVKKYEPPVGLSPQSNAKAVKKKYVNSNFKKYTSLENIKHYNNVFKEGEWVIATEKIHGTNFRCGYVPTEANTIWKKVKKFFGALPPYEFVYGSHNVQLQDKKRYGGYYKSVKNVYLEAVEKYNLEKILKSGEVLYGEIYGDGIQKGYTYGCGPGERKMIAFDLMKDGKYVDYIEMKNRFLIAGIDIAPEIFVGMYQFETLKELSKGDSILDSRQKVREGLVIRPLTEQVCHMGRKILKLINDDYLLKDTTEFH